MARRPRKAKPKIRFHRCARCHGPIPSGYSWCATCGFNADTDSLEKFVREAKRMFPGTREL